jgi:hypothetical protein
MMLAPSSHSNKRVLPGVKLPCWPDASRLAGLMTGDLSRVVFSYFVIGPFFGFALLFAFDQQLDSVLRLVGYDDNSASYFPFIRDLHSYFVASPSLGHVDIAYFHMLDVVLWLSIAVWGTWFATGIVFIRQYDDFFRVFLYHMSKRHRGRRLVVYLSWIWVLLIPFVLTFGSMKAKLLRDPQIIFFIARLPKLFFLILAWAYYYCGGLAFSLIALFFIWKIFRQKWPGVVLWRPEMHGEEFSS